LVFYQGQTEWIDNKQVRKKIAHGTEPVNIETVKDVVDKINTTISFVTFKDWRQKDLICRFHQNQESCSVILESSAADGSAPFCFCFGAIGRLTCAVMPFISRRRQYFRPVFKVAIAIQ